MASESFFSSEFFAALAGALVGGGISWLLQRQSFLAQERVRKAIRSEASRKDKDREIEADSMLAFSVLRKLTMTVTTVADMHNHLHDGFIASIRRRVRFAAALRPFTTDPEKFSFTLDELICIQKLRKADLLTEANDMPSLQAMYVDNMALFRTMKLAIDELGDVLEVLEDGRVTLGFKGQNAGRADMKTRELSQLLTHLWGRSWDDLKRVNNLTFDLQAAFREKLGADLKTTFDIARMPDAAPADRARRGMPAPPVRP